MASLNRQDHLVVTDFDGTMTQRDFYSVVVSELLSPEDLEPWQAYVAGRITHFEALQQIFQRIRASENELDAIRQLMGFDPQALTAIERLRSHGWDVIVVSNGCSWYIERFFQEHGIEAEVHSNPGKFSPTDGLQLQLPVDSPYFNRDVGIGKGLVLQDALQAGKVVAFAGDGRPDLTPALMVPSKRRFARGWLADELQQRDEGFHRLERWSDVAGILLG